ncbi:MAG: bifunctional DNA-formamidopyrimidine glycosylase/DNA-(apurinic or apyrimidinic site) lyase [Actinomycetes bacterium]
MPELPEVETVRRQLEPRLVGARVVEAWAFASPKFTGATAATGGRLTSVGRRGKYLLLGLDGPAGEPGRELVVHLGMTGRLSVRPADGRDDVRSPYLRAAWVLDDGRTLEFHDVRRFGRIAVVPAGRYETLTTLAHLGPEPWDPSFDGASLRTYVNARRRFVKTLLLSQRPVAGVGNIYADEALWRSRVHPMARRLTRDQAARLVEAVREVLAEGVAHGGTTLRDYRDADGAEGGHQHQLDCYGRGGQPCRRCGVELRHVVVDARGTTFCPTCQRR